MGFEILSEVRTLGRVGRGDRGVAWRAIDKKLPADLVVILYEETAPGVIVDLLFDVNAPRAWTG